MLGNNDISYNFSIAKIIAILMVLTGHFFGGILWIPTTVGLFVFGFSSGFFTATRYRGDFSVKEFWSKKINRLGFKLLTIDLFLLILFLVSGKKNIWNWHSSVAALGLNGVFDWMHIHKNSPFGNSLWFFTLLLIFYAIYPLIEKVNRSKKPASVLLIICLVVFSVCHYFIIVGHELWFTAFSFVFGAYIKKYPIKISPLKILLVGVISSFLLIYFNIAFDIKIFNHFFILSFSISIVLFLTLFKLPERGFCLLGFLGGCTLEIYFIHTYLFLPENIILPIYLRYFFSFSIIVICAFILSKISAFISSKYRSIFFSL